MNILVANWSWYPSGGDWTYVENLCRLYKEKGHNVIPFSMHHKKNYNSEYSKYFIENIDYKELNKNKNIINGIKVLTKSIYSLEAKRKLEELLSDIKIDIAHLNNIHNYQTLSIIDLLYKKNIPIIWTVHDYVILCPNTTFISHSKICFSCKVHKYYNCTFKKCKKGSFAASTIASISSYFNYLKGFYNKIDYFICPSKFIYNKFLEFGFPSEKLIYKNNLYYSSDLTEHINETLIEGPYLLYVGNLIRVKGIYTLLKAVKDLSIKLIILGDGEEYETLLKLKKELNLENVVFLGRVNKGTVACYLNNCTAVVQPSECFENMPYSLVEAMFFSKPLIGSRIGGIPEIVLDNITGYTFEPWNATDLRKAILKLLENPLKIREMGNNSKKLIEKLVSPDSYYNTLEKLFERLVK